LQSFNAFIKFCSQFLEIFCWNCFFLVFLCIIIVECENSNSINV
jgi:hypothetical protein